MATFTEDEVDFLRTHGNEECAKTWLGLWDAKRAPKMDHKDFMIEKYERKRFYLEPASPLKSIPSSTKLSSTTNTTTMSSSINSSASSTSTRSNDDLSTLKSVNLTPPSIVRQNAIRQHHKPSSASSSTTSSSSSSTLSSHQKRSNGFHDPFPHIEDAGSLFKHCKPTNGVKQTNGVKNNNHNFGDPFDVVPTSNQTNGLVNGCNGSMQNGNITNGGSGVMENFADFEHNQIYNAAGENPIFNNFLVKMGVNSHLFKLSRSI